MLFSGKLMEGIAPGTSLLQVGTKPNQNQSSFNIADCFNLILQL